MRVRIRVRIRFFCSSPYPTGLSPYQYAIIILLDIRVEKKKGGGKRI